MEKKVSIILPVYNAEEYLERCLDSILEQNYDNIELIAIDDGSIDKSWNILLTYKKNYPNKLLCFRQENMGVSKTRNRGIELATGDYLLLIDNDDYFDEDYINTFVKEIEKRDYDVVIGGYKRPNGQGKIVERVDLEDYEYSKFKIVAAWAKIYKLSYIKRNNIHFLNSNIGEDIHFTIQAVCLTNKIKIIDYTGYNWFYNENSVSNTAHKSLSNGLQFDYLLNSVYDKLKEKETNFDSYIEYYFIKLNVWFMLYASRKTSYDLVKKTYKDNFLWLEKRFPQYKKNVYLKPGKLKGETLSYSFIIWLFVKMINTKTIYIFLKLYCCI